MKKGGFREMDANANEALGRFYNREQWEPVCMEMPFSELLRKEDDGTDEPEIGDYEIRQRVAGVKAFFRFLTAKGAHPAQMLKQMADVGRGMGVEPFAKMTMHEQALMFSETAAAHSWRCKVLSKMIELSGMKGSRLPGQKTKDATASYKVVRRGNKNRKGGAKAVRREARHARKHGPDGRHGLNGHGKISAAQAAADQRQNPD